MSEIINVTFVSSCLAVQVFMPGCTSVCVFIQKRFTSILFTDPNNTRILVSTWYLTDTLGALKLSTIPSTSAFPSICISVSCFQLSVLLYSHYQDTPIFQSHRNASYLINYCYMEDCECVLY